MPQRRKPVTSAKKKGKKGSADRPLGVSELLQAAEAAILRGENAVPIYDAALVANATDARGAVHILEQRADVKVSLGDRDGACHDYERALTMLRSCRKQPLNAENADDDENAWTADEDQARASMELTIGQLSEGTDALTRYKNGIEAWRSCLRKREAQKHTDVMEEEGEDNTKKTLIDTRRNLAAAYCCAAELYMTDLCYEENAETECESLVQAALALNPPVCVDAFQTAASLRLSQSRPAEARVYALQAFTEMQAGCQALATLVGLREPDPNMLLEATELLELESVQALPGFEFRCQTAKLLLECAAAATASDNQDETNCPDCVAAALDVLGSLLAENDEVVEIWALTGDALASASSESAEAALHHWRRAREMLATVQTSLEQEQAESSSEEEDDALQEQLEEVLCQMEELTSKIDELEAGLPPAEMEE